MSLAAADKELILQGIWDALRLDNQEWATQMMLNRISWAKRMGSGVGLAQIVGANPSGGTN